MGEPPFSQAAPLPKKSIVPSSRRPVANPSANALSRNAHRKTNPMEILVRPNAYAPLTRSTGRAVSTAPKASVLTMGLSIVRVAIVTLLPILEIGSISSGPWCNCNLRPPPALWPARRRVASLGFRGPVPPLGGAVRPWSRGVRDRAPRHGWRDQGARPRRGLALRARRRGVPREVGGRLGAASDLELRQDARDVVLHGLLGEVELLADLLVGLAVGHERQDPLLLR